MAIPGLVAPGMGNFQSGPQVDAMPGAGRHGLVQAIMGLGAQPLSIPAHMPGRQVDNPLEMRPTYGMAMDNIARDTGNSGDPYQILATRWAPDKVEMPLVTGWIKGGPGSRPMPSVNPQSMERVIANQPQAPATGYRPGQVPGAAMPTPLLGRAQGPQPSPATGTRRFFGGSAGGYGMLRPRFPGRPKLPLGPR